MDVDHPGGVRDISPFEVGREGGGEVGLASPVVVEEGPRQSLMKVCSSSQRAKSKGE
jgi:hypothetical protein